VSPCLAARSNARNSDSVSGVPVSRAFMIAPSATLRTRRARQTRAFGWSHSRWCPRNRSHLDKRILRAGSDRIFSKPTREACLRGGNTTIGKAGSSVTKHAALITAQPYGFGGPECGRWSRHGVPRVEGSDADVRSLRLRPRPRSSGPGPFGVRTIPGSYAQ
jgi:hypothetical protein